MPVKSRILSEDEIEQVRSLAAYLTREQLADFLKMHINSFDKIRERQPEVDVAYKSARAETIGKVAQSLVQDALDGDATSRIFFLKTQAGWRETNRVDHTSSDGTMTPKPSINLDALTDDELEQLERITDKARNPEAEG